MSATTEQADVSPGLEDVVVAETRLSRVDGAAGHLTIAGRAVGELVDEHGFEGTVARLLARGADREGAERDEIERALGATRQEAYDALTTPAGGPRPALFDRDDAMEALRAAVGILSSRDDRRLDALRAIGAVPVANALWWRNRRGRDPLPPNPAATHASDYLRMLGVREPAERKVEALGTYMSAVSDHGLNASTFTARVITSTGSDAISALVGAIGALKGPLHGGAPGPVADMLDAIGEPERAEEWITDRLDSGERIMGMGHRVYDVRDPRAKVFETAVAEFAESGETGERLELARTVEETAERILSERHPDREIRANVEFYTAILLEAVGIPRELFSPTFAAGRSAGWGAHVLEQTRKGRLVRPRSRYLEEHQPASG